MLEATKRGMAWDLLLERKLGGVHAFAEWESFLNHIEIPGPKQVHRRVCKEISANSKFEEEYLKVHGASAW